MTAGTSMRHGILGIFLAVTFAVTGCDTDSGGDPSSDGPAAASPTVVPWAGKSLHVLVGGTTDSGSDVAVNGTVTSVGACAGLTVEGSDYAAVWPAGTSVDGDSLEVAGSNLKLGSVVTGTGSYESEPFPDAIPPLPEDCPIESGGEIVVLTKVEATP